MLERNVGNGSISQVITFKAVRISQVEIQGLGNICSSKISSKMICIFHNGLASVISGICNYFKRCLIRMKLYDVNCIKLY